MTFMLQLLLSLLLSGSAYALTVGEQASQMNLNSSLSVLEDPTGALTLADVQSGSASSRFVRPQTEDEVLHLGFSQSAYWLRIPMQRKPDVPSQSILEVPYAQLDELTFFAPGRAPVITGTNYPLSSRPIFYQYFAFPIELPVEETYFYLRVVSQYAITVPLKIFQPDEFGQQVLKTLLIQFGYFGSLLLLSIYNLFLFIALRDKRFLFYSLYAMFFGMAMFAGNGYGRLLLWPNDTSLDQVAQNTLLSLAAVFAVEFTRSFLRTSKNSRYLDVALKATELMLVVLVVIYVAASQFNMQVRIANHALLICALSICILVSLAGIQAMYKGDKAARFYLLATSVLWLGASVASARQFGWLPSNTVTLYALQISSALEILLLSLALADMVSTERKERWASQAQTLEAQEAMLQLLRNSEVNLERAVIEKTQQLTFALDREKDMLATYIRFGSLISHEFRNPLAIIKSQISLSRKEQHVGALHLDKRLDIMAGAVYRLQSLFDKWLQSDQLSSKMIETRPESLVLDTYLQNWLSGHRYLLTNRTIAWKCDPTATHVWADAQLLEVALTNLLENACKYSASGSAISLETCKDGSRVGITIGDTGIGIAPEQQGEIFQEFYRIHPQGTVTGLGLGLRIVQRIVVELRGEITLQSELGVGSRFCIWLPAPESMVNT